MPGWGELLKELNAELAGLPPDQAGPALDAKRVGYLKAMHDRTGRPVSCTRRTGSAGVLRLTSRRSVLRTSTA